MGDKFIWFDARKLCNEDIFQFVCNLYYECIIVDDKSLSKLKLPKKMRLIVHVDNVEKLDEIPDEATVLSDSLDIVSTAKNKKLKTAFYKQINNGIDMNEAWKIAEDIDYLIVEFKDETNIPLELIIAKLQNKNIRLLKVVHSSQQMEIAFGVMEVGSHGVVICTEDISEIKAASRFIESQKVGKIELVNGSVVDVQHIGMGYRACIDTTTLMNENEGMIIGSTSGGGLLVSSETHYLPYMELRPFRVNAGAVHSYVWASEGTTSYLTELKSGSKLICVDTYGNTREVTVGRVKIEMRPLLKIEVETQQGKRINTIVQDDWHIRIFGRDGKVMNASSIKTGDELLVYDCEGGRHVGIKIDESLQER